MANAVTYENENRTVPSYVVLPDLNKTKRLRNQLSRMEEARAPIEPIWQDVIDYVQPRRRNVDADADDWRKKIGVKVFDGTPAAALQLLADGLQGYLVAPSLQWFRLAVNNRHISDMPQVRQYLGDVERHIYSSLAGSNFYESMHEFFTDAGSLGTAVMYVEEDKISGRPRFRCIHPREVYIAENKDGRVDTVFRKFQLTARQAYQMFPQERLSMACVMDAFANPFSKHWFVHVVMPRRERAINLKDSTNKPWASYYFELNTEEDKTGEMLRESGYDFFPYAVWRWLKNSGEAYGVSPAMMALVDILKLNTMSKTMLQYAHRAADPAHNVPKRLRHEVQTIPGGFNFIAQGETPVTPVAQGGSYNIAKDQEDQVREVIRKHFRVDFFLMLAEAERQMTATEIIERQGEKAAVLGATIGRLNTEGMDPILDIVYSIEARAGRLPPLPPAIRQFMGETIDFDYRGPLAQAQKRLYETQNLLRGIEALAGLAQIDPFIMDTIDTGKLGRYLAAAMNMPEDILRTMEQIEEIRAQREVAQQAAQQAQELQQAGAGIRNIAQARQAAGSGANPVAAAEAAGAQAVA